MAKAALEKAGDRVGIRSPPMTPAPPDWRAASLVTVQVALDLDADVATLTLSGPAGVWFGAGFNASAMKDAPWAVVVDGAGAVTERKLADQNPGAVLAPSVNVSSSAVQGGVRTIRWVTTLSKARNAGLLARFGPAAGRLARVGGRAARPGHTAPKRNT